MQRFENDEQFLSGGGQMGELIRSMDWSTTALGPVSGWPQSLRTSVSLCLSSTFPILIAWGPELIQIYNDSYRPICGAKHPESMGQNFKICWETALPVVGAAFDRGLAGEGTYIKDQQMLLDRYGYIEEAFMTFSFAPIRDESGNVGGIFHPITETTDQILSARRTQVLRDLAIRTADAKSNQEICDIIAQVQGDFVFDVPFLQIYELDHYSGQTHLQVSAGLSGSDVSFTVQELTQTNSWPTQLTQLTELFPETKSGPFELSPQTALVFPISIAGQESPYGYVVAGVSSGRSLDQEYQNFFALFANTVSTAFSNVDAYQQQQKRAQQLAEIDRAKTAFFSNVSHEFRTPLTLILGPLQQAIDHPETGLARKDYEPIYRNAQRLLKLVNNLLDFSRMEAGRVKASFEQVSLGELTEDLASNFRSVVESAGMELIIEVQHIEAPVYVDTDMWEKIVLNLISNAFKYTLAGSITVQVMEAGDQAILSVRDTGVGIPEHELPHMFERFHRVENALGRTHEGTGIGLSLVSELVNLHHGMISVDSVFGEGSTFTVKIPTGSKHLSQDQIIEGKAHKKVSLERQTFIREAMSLLDAENIEMEEKSSSEQQISEQEFSVQKEVKVLVVDDNADMRAYIGRLLSPYFTIDFAVNGQDALDKIALDRPDVIISDVMMPVMDGKQLLIELRQRPGIRVPVILLSARAGEEARVEGLGWGADDYLVKPFMARELISKVSSVVRINSITQKTEAELRNFFLRAPVAIGVFRGPGLIIELANNMMLRYWGKTSEQVLGATFARAFEEAPSDGFEKLAKEVFDSGERKVLYEWPLAILRHGRPATLFVNLVFEPLHDITGVTTGVMVVANDVTELITALELARESEQRFKLLANSTPQLVWRIDKTGGKNFYNDYILKYSGLSEEMLQQNGMIAMVHPDDREDNLVHWQKSLTTGEDFIYEHRYRRYDGEYRWHLSRGVAQRGPSGTIENWLGASTDIHDKKMLEETLEKHVSQRTAELKKINEQLLNSNRELEQFAHVTSHDLQEPLRKIQIFSQLVEQNIPGGDTVAHDYLRRIGTSSERMSHLIRDLLSFARVASSDGNFEPTDLNIVLKQVLEDFEFLIEQKGAVIEVGELPVIEAVPLQMNQLFYNLLGNALKFSSDNTRVEIGARYVDKVESSLPIELQPDEQYVCLVFRDYGIGFDQQFADRIFTIFQRLHTVQNFEGTGIGLSICKRIVDNHAGVIVAKGVKGEGATFEVYLPVAHKSAD
ncbi:diguanylate cyclase [Dyadobacter luteus]|uniref:histidine kinase n=1 Tax=Dyadobacter luteus TaxID=2259619 RepID=A0A3D8Y4N0_9BACT|nr:ATP-binding protein [Dyadobacter luteus]REA57394.1 diguanylate cyclase [Dyadobacter luteus]